VARRESVGNRRVGALQLPYSSMRELSYRQRTSNKSVCCSCCFRPVLSSGPTQRKQSLLRKPAFSGPCGGERVSDSSETASSSSLVSTLCASFSVCCKTQPNHAAHLALPGALHASMLSYLFEHQMNLQEEGRNTATSSLAGSKRPRLSRRAEGLVRVARVWDCTSWSSGQHVRGQAPCWCVSRARWDHCTAGAAWLLPCARRHCTRASETPAAVMQTSSLKRSAASHVCAEPCVEEWGNQQPMSHDFDSIPPHLSRAHRTKSRRTPSWLRSRR
jgi:hypothetical protein